MNLPALSEPCRLPAEYHETPARYLARQLDRLQTPSPRLVQELRAVVASLRVTTSRAEVEALEARLVRLSPPRTN